MTFLRKKTFWIMLFIVVLGFVLRILFIDKIDGLWNDEYVSWMVASIPFGKDFFSAIFAQCHMPLYYFYLKFFIHFFGNSDLMLRLTSVPVGVLAIIAMYFVGKELKNEKVGILCASMCAISSFLIYFSQEVRFYELLFLFSALSMLYTVKLGKIQNKSNVFLYILFNTLIILTHTIGFIFVFLNFIFVSIWLIKQNNAYKKNLTVFWGLLGLIGIICLPLAIHTIVSHPLSQCWGNFTIAKLGFFITDYFSPVLTNIVSSPDKFFYNFTLGFFIFAIVPSLISVVGMIKGLGLKNYALNGLFYVAISYVLILIFLAVFGKMMFVTKYSIEVYPILIAVVCIGLLEFKKIWSHVLVFIYVFLSMFYLLTSPISAPKIRRSEGHRIVANLLKNADLKPGDVILLNYYPKDRFEKYFDFSKYDVISINKGNFYEYLGTSSVDDVLKDGKNIYKNAFSKTDSLYFDKKFSNEVISKVKSHKKLVVVILNDVAMYSPMQLIALSQNEKTYKKAPFVFLSFSYIKNLVLKECMKQMQIRRLEQKGSWAVIEFEKI